MTNHNIDRGRFESKCPPTSALCALLFFVTCAVTGVAASAQQTPSNSTSSELTPRQRSIEKERLRLSSGDQEERRDAVMRLASMKHPDASRAASSALADSASIIRATATGAVLSLPSEQAVVLLLPLLKDKNEFVRREAAYALGETRNSRAVEGLVAALETDKESGVRGAAAVALGLIGDEKALNPLAGSIDLKIHSSLTSDPRKKSKVEKDVFVQRSAVRSLGQIGSRIAVPVLSAAMTNERLTFDVRREAANSLGLIGDPSAVPVLRTVLDAPDAYLSKAAFDALARITRYESQRKR